MPSCLGPGSHQMSECTVPQIILQLLSSSMGAEAIPPWLRVCPALTHHLSVVLSAQDRQLTTMQQLQLQEIQCPLWPQAVLHMRTNSLPHAHN